MPSKFSCRQLRETGQSFESFLVVRGLDMETDRERLRTIYNRDFKIRYAPAHSPAQNRAPSLPPRSPRRGQPSRVGAERDAAPRVAQARLGAVPTSPPAICPRPTSAARSALAGPGPCAKSPRRASRSARPHGAAGPGRGRGGGDPRERAQASRARGERAACWWRQALPRALRGPPPPC